MSTMQRVDRVHYCKVCLKTDWCLYGVDVAICMRVPSHRPKHFSDGTVGYLHSQSGDRLPEIQPKKAEVIHVDSAKLVDTWRKQYGLSSLAYLAQTLGVDVKALELLECVKAPQHLVWGFPMRDGRGFIIGIRMRHANGRKWCEPGGHNGLFVPNKYSDGEITICEGPTDTAAALSLGLNAIGRFNCCGGIGMIQEHIKKAHIKRATIVADVDNDRVVNGSTINPGIQGAIALAEVLGIPTRCVTLPTKDIRNFLLVGGTRLHFDSIANQQVWNKP